MKDYLSSTAEADEARANANELLRNLLPILKVMISTFDQTEELSCLIKIRALLRQERYSKLLEDVK